MHSLAPGSLHSPPHQRRYCSEIGEATRSDGTGLYVRCSKLLWKKEISTGLYVLMNDRSSGFCVRFDGILRAPFLYIPVGPGREPVVGLAENVNL